MMRRKSSDGLKSPSSTTLHKLIVAGLLSAALVHSTCSSIVVAAGPEAKDRKAARNKDPREGREKPARGTEKVARKSDDPVSRPVSKYVPKAIADNHPLKPSLNKAEASLQAVRNLDDYSAVLFKREMVQSKLVTQTLTMKLRHEPFSVYLKFQEPHAGREVIYVDGQNKGKFLVHETGFKALAGTLSFLPTSKEAMAENRYPITHAGMEKMLAMVIDQWHAEGEFQEVQVKHGTGAKVGDVVCDVVEVTHPQPRDHFRFHKTKLYIATDSKLPIRLEQYTWPESTGGQPVLAEEYTYTDIKTNIGMKDHDFDKSNPAYQF